MLTRRGSIAEQIFQTRARGGFALVGFRFRHPSPARKFKIFAKVADVLFEHRLGPSFAALLSHMRIVMRAVQADAQVGAAFHARLAATGLAGKRPKLAAIMAMAIHIYDLRYKIYDCPDDASSNHKS
jgi:hypothetical protein